MSIPTTDPTAAPEQLLTASLPLAPDGRPEVVAGSAWSVSRHADTTVHVWGLPFYSRPGLNAATLAEHWDRDAAGTLMGLDGPFLLMATRGSRFWVAGDRISPLTWYFRSDGQHLTVSNSLCAMANLDGGNWQFDYAAFRHHVFTRGHHFDECVVEGVQKLPKAHWLDGDATPRRFYDFSSSIRAGTEPDDYFEHIYEYARVCLRGRKVAALASNGDDSRMVCTVLSEVLDEFDVFTLSSDAFSEHRELADFLGALPNQNYRLRTLHYSYAPESPQHPRRLLSEHADTFLACSDDLTENKEHLMFVEVFDVMRREGYDVLATGNGGGLARRVMPSGCLYPRPAEDLDRRASPRLQRMMRVTDQMIAERYVCDHDDADRMDPRRERLGHGQMNYTQPLLLNAGIMHVPLPLPTTEAMEIYRGIDRKRLLAEHGYINFYRDFIKDHVPASRDVPYVTGLALFQPFERDPWLESTLDLDFAVAKMEESGLIDGEFLRLMRDTHGRQQEPFAGSTSFLSLWSWFTVATRQPELFTESLLERRGAESGSRGVGRTVRRGFERARIFAYEHFKTDDDRSTLYRWKSRARGPVRRVVRRLRRIVGGSGSR